MATRVLNIINHIGQRWHCNLVWMDNLIVTNRAPDKLRICVFYAMKTSKNACIIRSECTFTHTYCCVSKLSKFGAYLYAVDDNTSCT